MHIANPVYWIVKTIKLEWLKMLHYFIVAKTREGEGQREKFQTGLIFAPVFHGKCDAGPTS